MRSQNSGFVTSQTFFACIIAVLLRYSAGIRGRGGTNLIFQSLRPKEPLLHNKSHPVPGWLLRVVIDQTDGQLRYSRSTSSQLMTLKKALT
jgi:hypothetical protein